MKQEDETDSTTHAPGWTTKQKKQRQRKQSGSSGGSSKMATAADRRPPSPGDSGGPSDWRALAPTTLDSAAVSALRWGAAGAAGGVLGASGRDMVNGTHILAETVLHRQLR